MTTRVRTRNTWFMGMLMFIVLGLIFVSCNSDDGGNPISPQGGEESDFIASQGQTDQWGAYYTEGAGSFYVNVPQAGDYQLKYTTRNGGPYYITFDTPERAILEVGLQSGDELADACVSSGTIAVPEQTANVGIKYSWKVTVYSVTDAEGDNVSWWNPGSDAQMLFTADPNGENVCVIQDGKLGAGIVEIDPPDKGGDGGGTTPPPAGSTLGISASTANASLTVSGCGTGLIAGSPGQTVTVTSPTAACNITLNKGSGGTENVTISTTLNAAPVDNKTCNNVTTATTAMNMGSVNADGTGASALNCPCTHAFSLSYTNAIGTTHGLYYRTDAGTAWSTAITGTSTYTNSAAIATSSGTYNNLPFYAVDLYSNPGTTSSVGNISLSLGSPNTACQTVAFANGCTMSATNSNTIFSWQYAANGDVVTMPTTTTPRPAGSAAATATCTP